jgi:hypothetical protein
MGITQLLEAIPWKDLEAYTNVAEGTLESAFCPLFGDRQEDWTGRQFGDFILEPEPGMWYAGHSNLPTGR